jgi:hypothetical protein
MAFLEAVQLVRLLAAAAGCAVSVSSHLLAPCTAAAAPLLRSHCSASLPHWDGCYCRWSRGTAAAVGFARRRQCPSRLSQAAETTADRGTQFAHTPGMGLLASERSADVAVRQSAVHLASVAPQMIPPSDLGLSRTQAVLWSCEANQFKLMFRQRDNYSTVGTWTKLTIHYRETLINELQ